MSLSDGKASSGRQVANGVGPSLRPQHIAVRTADGAITITNQDREVQKIDPDGASRNVTLAASCEVPGTYFRFVNAADAAENLVIKDSAGNTIGTANQNEQIEVWYSDADTWIMLAVTTIALS